jgi:hypothetical protein
MYRGVVERDGDGMAYGCEVTEYELNPEKCTAGGWGFIIVGIVGIFYSVAVLHTAIFGCLTWLKRLEAPPATHGLGPKPNVTAVRTLSTLITHRELLDSRLPIRCCECRGQLRTGLWSQRSPRLRQRER